MNKTDELLKNIKENLQKANTILEVREEIETEQHKQFIAGMETIKTLMIKFPDNFDLDMVDYTIKDYKKHFNIDL